MIRVHCFMKGILLLGAMAILTGCATSGYSQFYKPFFDAWTTADVQVLSEGDDPKILSTDDIQRDVLVLKSKNYMPVGYSSFNGGYEDTKNAVTQAKKVGAIVVLVSAEYTNTLSTTSTLLIPNSSTTYHSGSVSGSSTYNSAYGGYLGSSQSYGTYSGSSTTYGSTAVPYTTHQRRYDQAAVYFVKNTRKMKFGVYFENLSPELRARLERNTGVLINVVVEGSPAFRANVLPGDVITMIDGIEVSNVNDAMRLMSNISPEKESSELTVIRKGSEKIIEVVF